MQESEITPTQPRSRKMARKLGLTLLSLLVICVIGEALVRGLTTVRRPLLVVDAELGRRYVANFEGSAYSDESDREVLLEFNSHGLRFPETPFEKPPGVHRLIVIGDSLIAGLEVEERDTTCVRLQEKLARDFPEERWEVLNFGVSGAGTGQELVLYRELARRFQPDVVLCAFFVGNDLLGNSTRMSKLNYIYFDLDESGELVQVPFPSLRLRFNELLNEHSRLYVWQKWFVNHKRRDLQRAVAARTTSDERLVTHGDSIRMSEWVFCRTEPGAAAYTWDVTDALIEAFAADVAKDGARFGLVMIPDALQLNDGEFAMVRELAGEVAVVAPLR